MRTRQSIGIRAVAVAAQTLAAGLSGSAAAQRGELEKVERGLAQERAVMERLTQEHSSVLGELDRWEEQLAPLEAEARVSRRAAETAASRLVEDEKRETEAKQQLDQTLDALAPRLRARYRLGRSGAAVFLASSSSAGELVRRTRLLDLVLQDDLAGLRRAKTQAAELAQAHQASDRQRLETELHAKAAASKASEARAHRAQLARLSVQILDQESLHQRTVAELEAQFTHLNELIEKSRGAGYAGHGIAAADKGKLPFPTAGVVEVGFGRIENPKFHTVTVQKGLDIRAPAGAPVIAVAPGKIVHSGWFRGYGNLVIIDHGDGFHTLAAHLAVAVGTAGAEVAAGDVIGEVGETGSLKGPYLYFEVRHRGKPVDPAEWLSRP